MAGLEGYVCPPGSPTAGTSNPVSWCIGQVIQGQFHGCPHPCVSPPLLAKMHDVEQRNHHKGVYISASMLTGSGCNLQTWFERRHGFYDSPERRFWPFRGTLTHALIESGPDLIAQGGWLQEIRMSVPLVFKDEPAPVLDAQGDFTGQFDATQPLTIELGGTTDAYNPVRRKLDDFKSMGDGKVVDMVKLGHAKDTHEAQLNIYRWLIAHTRIDEALAVRLRAVGFDPTGHTHLPAPDNLAIQAVSMMHLAQTGTTVQMKLKRAMGRGSDKLTFDVEPVRVWPLEEIEAYVRPRAYQWYRWLVLGEKPPVVSDADKWVCLSCPFNVAVADHGVCDPVRERLRLAKANNPDQLELQ